MGRPKIEVDFDSLDKLCALQCTEEEIAQFFECSVDTVARRCQEVHGMTFAEYFAQKRGSGKVALRRAQWQLAQDGNATMQIWLGKQYLNQKDKSALEHSGPDGKPIETKDLSKLSDEQIQARLAELMSKRNEVKE